MKIRFFMWTLFLFISTHVVSQIEETPRDIHSGIQASAFFGPGFGNITGYTEGLGNIVFRGHRINGTVQIGYAYRNWAAGFSFGISTFNVESMEYQDTAYMVDLSSIDNEIFGLYIKRYFMPINVFVTTNLGISSYDLYNSDYDLVGTTDKGFYWDVIVGKEFVIGKRKRFGLGPYLGVNSISCHDLPPYENDRYSHFSFCAGGVFSFH